jgi:stage V sporulation protein D (sporulation-specific penicillin-binding protein)
MTVTKSFSTVEKRQVISEKTSENLRNILESVVTEGTGSNAYTIGFRVAGKTGTSEKIDKKNQTGKEDLRIASFGAFAPANNPQIAV